MALSTIQMLIINLFGQNYLVGKEEATAAQTSLSSRPDKPLTLPPLLRGEIFGTLKWTTQAVQADGDRASFKFLACPLSATS